jgi:hypothetical protein
MVHSETKWDKTNDSPLTYTSRNNRWGLVRTSLEDWELHLVRHGKSARLVTELSGIGVDPPFEAVQKDIMAYEKSRGSANWSESMIGSRKPGQEGPGGGRPIPMQTRRPRR